MKTRFILITLILLPILAMSQASLQRSMNTGIQTLQNLQRNMQTDMNNRINYGTGNTFWNYKLTSRLLENRLSKKINYSIKLEEKTEKIKIDLKDKNEKLASLTNNLEKDKNAEQEIEKSKKEIAQYEKKILKIEKQKEIITEKIELSKLKVKNYKEDNEEFDKKLKEQENIKKEKKEA